MCMIDSRNNVLGLCLLPLHLYQKLFVATSLSLFVSSSVSILFFLLLFAYPVCNSSMHGLGRWGGTGGPQTSATNHLLSPSPAARAGRWHGRTGCQEGGGGALLRYSMIDAVEGRVTTVWGAARSPGDGGGTTRNLKFTECFLFDTRQTLIFAECFFFRVFFG